MPFPVVVSAAWAGYDSSATLIDMYTPTDSRIFQIAISRDVCHRMQIQPGAQLTVVEFNGALRLFPATSPSSLRGIARSVDALIQRESDRAL